MRNLLKNVQRLVGVLFWGLPAAGILCEYSILRELPLKESRDKNS